tara:strand:+ start:36 stop:161 length:126 start_codon:yes stop_codon:yes gene_type:complete
MIAKFKTKIKIQLLIVKLVVEIFFIFCFFDAPVFDKIFMEA